MLFTATPTLVNGILSYAIIYDSNNNGINGNNGVDFVQYSASTGIGAATFSTSLSAGGNVKLTGANNVGNFSSSVNALMFAGSATLNSSGSNALTIASGLVISAGGSSSITLSSGQVLNLSGTDNVVLNEPGSTLTINGSVSETGMLTKDHGGTLILQGNDAGIGGPVNVDLGTLNLQNSSALGSATSATVSVGAALELQNPNGTTGITLPSTLSLTLNSPVVSGASTYSGDSVATSTVEEIVLNGTTGGSFTLTFNGATTAPISYVSGTTAMSASIQNALTGLATIGTGNVTVAPANNPAGTLTSYIVTFSGTLANTSVNQITANGALLAGASIATGTIVHGGPAYALHNVSGNNTLLGSVILNTASVLIGTEQGSQLNIGNSGVATVISGSATANGLIKFGTGTLAFAGNASNTYTGTTTVNEGSLLLEKSGTAVAIPGPLVIGDAAGSINSALPNQVQPDLVQIVTPAGSTTDGTVEIAAAATVTILSSGQLDLSGGNLTLTGAITMSGGTISTDNGVLTVANVTYTAGAQATISGVLNLNNGARIFTVAAGNQLSTLGSTANPYDDLVITADILGANGTTGYSSSITKSGAGALALDPAVPAANEQETITLVNASSGTFVLDFLGYSTSSISYGASASTVASQLNTLLQNDVNLGYIGGGFGIGSSTVQVTSTSLSTSSMSYTITFMGALADTAVPLFSVDPSTSLSASQPGAGYGQRGLDHPGVRQLRANG